MKGRVLAGKLLVKQDDALEKTEGGIIIPDTASEKPCRGTVIVAGDGTENVPMQVSVGDVVYWKDHQGTSFSLDEKELSLNDTYVLLDQYAVLFIKTKK